MGGMDITKNESGVAIVRSGGVVVNDSQSAIDLIASVQYETGSSDVAIYKEAVGEDFFDLRSGIAGEVLQKFITYRFRIAIIGDFSMYESKALHDFIFECNNGQSIFFVPDEDAATVKFKKGISVATRQIG
jgi:hypothetical protein